jgi:L-alanine-DL-glutamate epimerase-like enolase superfamily enzyme
MRIETIDYIPFEPRYFGKGFVMASVRHTILRNRLIRLRLENGLCAIGEVARGPKVLIPNWDQVELEQLDQLRGARLCDIPAFVHTLQNGPSYLRGLAFALDTAFHDLIARSCDIPLSVLLGGPESGSIPSFFSISCETPEEMAEVMKTKAAGFPIIQAKLGTDCIATDLERVHAVLECMETDHMLLADFNGGLSLETALAELPQLTDPRIMWEEPCATYQENMTMARRLRNPVMFDQCMQNQASYIQLIRDGVGRAVVLKPAYLGGLANSRGIRDMLAVAGIQIRLDGPWAGQIAAASTLHVALGVPERNLIGSINLTEPLDTPCDMVLSSKPGRIATTGSAGYGPLPADVF